MKKVMSACTLVLAMAAGAQATDTVNVNANINGTTKQIGSIAIDSETGKKADHLTAKFTFAAAHKTLDDTYDFRWINVLTGVVKDGNAVNSHVLLGTLPGIDPSPADGPEPFYYNNTEWTSGTFGSETIRSEKNFSMFSDSPDTNTYDSFTFKNFLVVQNVSDPDWTDPKKFCVLAGYQWDYTKGTTRDINPTDDWDDDTSVFNSEIAITAGVIDMINEAIGNASVSGDFEGWSAARNCELVPAPGAGILLAAWGLAMARRRRSA